jgi:hypothetical protein
VGKVIDLYGGRDPRELPMYGKGFADKAYAALKGSL